MSAIVITKPTTWIASHRQGRLNSQLTEADIDMALGSEVIKETETSGDGKVTRQWDFLADGVACSIWDYKGARWSFYGPASAFREIFSEANVMYEG